MSKIPTVITLLKREIHLSKLLIRMDKDEKKYSRQPAHKKQCAERVKVEKQKIKEYRIALKKLAR